MADNIGQMVGSAVNALPLDRMFKIPALAMADTQKQLSYNYMEWVKNVGLDKDGNVIMVSANYDEDVLDEQGNVVKTVKKKLQVPLLSILTHPNVNVQEGTVEFEMTIQSSEESSSATEGEASLEAKAGWGPFSVKITGRASHKSSQTRKTDTRARYAVNMKIAKDSMPEGMSQFMEMIQQAVTQPKIAAPVAK